MSAERREPTLDDVLWLERFVAEMNRRIVPGEWCRRKKEERELRRRRREAARK